MKKEHNHNLAIYFIITMLVLFWVLDTLLALSGGLHEAVKMGDEVRICELLDSNPNLINSTYSYGLTPENYNMTPLHWAARMGYDNIAKILINRKANINAQTTTGRTPLHMACIRGFKKMVDTLINNGANVNISDKFGSTSLHYAAANGSAEVVKLLLKSNANIKAVDIEGNTPLHIAALLGKNAAIKVFAEVVNDFSDILDIKNLVGNTPLHLAVDGKKPKTINLLAKLGAKVESKNYNGETPLHLASKNFDFDCIINLLQLGADPNSVDNNYNTPLILLAISAHNKIFFATSRKHENQIRNDLKKIAIELLKVKANPYHFNKNGINFVQIASNVLNKHDLSLIINEFYK